MCFVLHIFRVAANLLRALSRTTAFAEQNANYCFCVNEYSPLHTLAAAGIRTSMLLHCTMRYVQARLTLRARCTLRSQLTATGIPHSTPMSNSTQEPNTPSSTTPALLHHLERIGQDHQWLSKRCLRPTVSTADNFQRPRIRLR